VIRPAVLIAGVALALAAAGCGGGGGSAASSGGGGSGPASTPSTPASSTTSSAATTTIDPNFAFGQTVLVTSKGIRPKELVSVWHKPVIWQNQTGHAIRVIFDHTPVSSPVIPAHGSWRYNSSTAGAFAYHVTTRPTLHGAVQVTPASN